MEMTIIFVIDPMPGMEGGWGLSDGGTGGGLCPLYL